MPKESNQEHGYDSRYIDDLNICNKCLKDNKDCICELS